MKYATTLFRLKRTRPTGIKLERFDDTVSIWCYFGFCVVLAIAFVLGILIPILF